MLKNLTIHPQNLFRPIHVFFTRFYLNSEVVSSNSDSYFHQLAKPDYMSTWDIMC